MCYMVAELIFRWERLTHESSRMRGVNSSGSASPQGKHSKGQRSGEPERHHKDEGKTRDKWRCKDCNRVAHDRDTCRMTNHPNFVKTGLWAGSATELAIGRAVPCVVCHTKVVVNGVVQGRWILDSSLSHSRIASSVALPAHKPVLTKSEWFVMQHVSRSWATRLQP